MKPFEILAEAKRRSAEAVIAQSGLTHDGLRKHLRGIFSGDDPKTALIQEPILEGAHPFVAAPKAMAEYSGLSLNAAFISALDNLPTDNDYRFPANRKPFLHQAESWRLLSEPHPQSVLVTSGTGSGKTECFLFPILSALADQVERTGEALEGVQAIMLYPLNALIESQRERLSAWTKPFAGKLRYCLYNGSLPEAARADARRRSPEQVIDRERLRESPPPVLVTNITMLEYMVARGQDRPILEKSRGKLKWIVLDEAHSLAGAAAAETALLLRRVMLTFGVKPEEVRFVATSATIGSGEAVKADLQKFLADIAGVPADRVHVVEGHRQMPGRPVDNVKTPDGFLPEDPTALYDVLGRNPATWKLVHDLFKGGVPLREFHKPATSYNVSGEELVLAMARAARKAPESGLQERLAPVRIHAFQRAIPGVWSCINPACSAHPVDWTFGGVLTERADVCPDCKAPVLEVVSCTECGETFLEGVERRGTLYPPLRHPPQDEFAFDSARDRESSDEDEDKDEASSGEAELVIDRLFAVKPTAGATKFWFDPATWRITDGGSDHVVLRCEEHAGARFCPHCRPEGAREEILRPVRFGAPFILGNVAPILLDGLDPEERGSAPLPAQGRRLISFTDSRQGTARLAAKLQTEAERNFVRSFIYHQLQHSMSPSGDSQEIASLTAKRDDFRKLYEATRAPVLVDTLAEAEKALSAKAGGSTEGIAWNEMVARLARRIEVEIWIHEVWSGRDEMLFRDGEKMAQFLLFREFDRRPKFATSIESLGLAKLRNTPIAALTQAQLPDSFASRGGTLADWQAYLDTVLTHFVRNNRFTTIDVSMLHWISHKGVLNRRKLVGPDSDVSDPKKMRGWPNGYRRAHLRSRPVALLLAGLKLDLDSSADRAVLDDCLHRAWKAIQRCLADDPEWSAYDFSRTVIAPVTEAFFCPATRRILDCAPFGLTPYGLDGGPARRAERILIPQIPQTMVGAVDRQEGRAAIHRWIVGDPQIAALRDKGAWSNISDRIALFSDYARSAEHSAQQEGWRLREYERQFKNGEINILNCSTTMEMGVDIGSVSAVMMTNVPPAITNYRQRVGRAGRRGQAASLAFTFCKDRPLDQEAFRNPGEYLNRTMSAPKVTLSSRPIVQRHVNAWLLAAFMRERAGDAMKAQVGAFFGCPAAVEETRVLASERPSQQFLEWLTLPSTRLAHDEPLLTIVRYSALESDRTLIDQTKEALETIEQRFVSEWEGLRALARDEALATGGKSRMAVQLKRLCGEFLLSGLADRGFLPGHGFPTDVVTFLPAKLEERNAPDGVRQQFASGPQRSLDLAIRDYAPGSEIVLNGLVHKSAGVTLNWKRPASEGALHEIQSLRSFWQCESCGAGETARGNVPDICEVCGSGQIKRLDFLRPAGFTVDPREKPHVETDVLSYVPPEAPAVSAGAVAWRNLPVPELGQYRCSREGLVFYSNKGGPESFGYAVCLECGRAAPDSEEDGNPQRKNPLNDHRPLRLAAGAERCPGNEKPFGIKRNLSLGHEITTDVFELQPRAGALSRAAANALVIALREALARLLGIDADEMGFAVADWRNVLGGNAVSVYLFDRAAGGAGFATLFEDHVRDVIEEAGRILDCKTPGCKNACAACVLVSDAPRGVDALNRIAAWDFLREHLSFPQDLALEDRFVGDAQLSLMPGDEIGRRLMNQQGAALTLFVPEGSEMAFLSEWLIARQFLNWADAGHAVVLAVSSNTLRGWSAAEKLVLRDFALHHHLRLMIGEVPIFANGAAALAAVGNGTGQHAVWATRDRGATLPGPTWGVPGACPIVRGLIAFPAALLPMDLANLLPPPGAYFREIDEELDCASLDFGKKAAVFLKEALTQIGVAHGNISSISYSDSYVSSPLVACLLIDTISALVKSVGGSGILAITTRPPRSDERNFNPSLINHDWREPGILRTTIESYGKLRGLAISVKQIDAVPHGRFLEVRFSDAMAANIVLDQGFGTWRPVTRMRFDFSRPAAQQAQQLMQSNVLLKRKGAGKSYLVARKIGKP